MKKILHLSVVLICISMAWAQQAVKNKAAAGKSGDRNLEGTLIAIDKAHNTAVIQVNYLMHLDPSIAVTKKGKTASVNDLILNSKVRSLYYKTPDGKRIVTKINQKSDPAPAQKAAEAKATEKEPAKKKVEQGKTPKAETKKEPAGKPKVDEKDSAKVEAKDVAKNKAKETKKIPKPKKEKKEIKKTAPANKGK